MIVRSPRRPDKYYVRIITIRWNRWRSLGDSLGVPLENVLGACMDQESRRDYAQGSGNTEAGPKWDEAVCGEIIPRLERVLRASNDGYWEWNRGAQFVWVSRRWSEIAGIPAGGEFVTLAEAKAAIHPDDLADLVQKTTGI